MGEAHVSTGDRPPGACGPVVGGCGRIVVTDPEWTDPNGHLLVATGFQENGAGVGDHTAEAGEAGGDRSIPAVLSISPGTDAGARPAVRPYEAR